MSSNLSFGTAFTLEDIDHNQIIEMYNRGFFENAQIPQFQTHASPITLFKDIYDGVEYNNIFKITINGVENICLTTNCARFNQIYRGVENPRNTKVDFCFWCHQPTPQPYGAKISFKKFTFGETSVIAFYEIDNYCDDSCAYSGIERERLSDPIFYEGCKNFESTTQYYRSLHGINEFLRPANPWRLLDVNDGPLTVKQWKNHDINISYYQTTGVVCLPTKFIYQKIVTKPN